MATTQPAGEDFPDGIPVTVQSIIVEGLSRPLELPQRYYDFGFVLAHFPAPTRRVRALVGGDRLEPVEIVPGLAVVSIAAFEYRVMATLAPYKEVGIMVPVRHAPPRRVPLLPLLCPERYGVGFWVHHLPVTTEEARVAGVDVWGLPKVLATITFADVGWMRRCQLWEDGQHVLTLSAAMAETRQEARPFTAYSRLNGELLSSLVDTRGQYHAWNVPGRASLELGTHPLAGTLRGLDVQRVAVAGLFAFSARSRLHPGQPLPALAATAPGGA